MGKNFFIHQAMLGIICVILILLLFMFASYKYQSDKSTRYYQESIRELNNPYTGWYRIFQYLLSDTNPPDLSGPFSPGEGSQLVLVEINLKEYRDRPVSETGLWQLDRILSLWQDAGCQIILRFLYDWEGKALETEPRSRQQVLEHMSQTAEVVNRYSRSVFLMQGIFVGNYGEMHGTLHMEDDGCARLVSHLASVIDPDIFLSVRTPSQLRSIVGDSLPLNKKQAYTGSLPSRLGLFNDGLLGSSTDLGTYQSVADRADEIAFQKEHCLYVPNGGEVVLDNPYNDLTPAIDDLSAMHVSYLNRDYDAAVLQKWKASTYEGEDELWQGVNGYDYISCHLGYRYVLRSSKYTALWPRGNVEISLSLENTGFSSGYRPFDVELIAADANGNSISTMIRTDTRLWAPGEVIHLQASLSGRLQNSAGRHIYLKITDPATGNEIMLANDIQHTDAGYLLY